jgi:hypothetical protein
MRCYLIDAKTQKNSGIYPDSNVGFSGTFLQALFLRAFIFAGFPAICLRSENRNSLLSFLDDWLWTIGSGRLALDDWLWTIGSGRLALEARRAFEEPVRVS